MLHWIIDFAKKNGASDVRVAHYYGSESGFEYRNSELDKIHSATDNALTIQLYVDGCFGSISTNRIEKSELESWIIDGIKSVRMLAKDTFRRLPELSLCYRGGGEDLETSDDNYNNITIDEKLQVVSRAASELDDKTPKLISRLVSYRDGETFSHIVNSKGFEAKSHYSYYNLSAEISVQGKGESRPEAYFYDSAIFFDTLQKDGLVIKAYNNAIAKIGAKKIKKGNYTIVVENRVASRLLSPMLYALNGSAIQQNNSFLADKLDSKVMSDICTIIDNPHQKRAIGAAYFDNEGLATAKRTVVDKGVLKTFYFDTYSARKMSVKPTTNTPILIDFELGIKDKSQLIASQKEAILITGFNGGNCNSTTGDFSYGIEGFLIKDGIIVKPINEMNISGNMLELWDNIVEVGNDPKLNSPRRVPTLVFADVYCSGA